MGFRQSRFLGVSSIALLAGLLALSGMAGTLTGCHESLEEACADKLPRFVEEIQYAMDEMHLNRSLASDEGVTAPSIDKAWWQEWARARLKLTQAFADFESSQPDTTAIHEELNLVGNALVGVHAYAGQGNLDRMHEELRVAQSHARRAMAMACPAPDEED